MRMEKVDENEVKVRLLVLRRLNVISSGNSFSHCEVDRQIHLCYTETDVTVA